MAGRYFSMRFRMCPAEVQKQLLLVLESRRVRPLGAPREIPIDVKIVAASNTSLTRAVRNGEFRADLFMRLCPATAVVLPPLRERTDDLHFLATRMVQGAAEEPTVAELKLQVAEALGLPSDCPLQLSIAGHKSLEPHTRDDVLQLVMPKAAWQQLRRHGWPGNIRELAMVINNLVTFTLVEAVDAWRSGVQLSARRLQINPGLVGQLLSAAAALRGDAADASVAGPGRGHLGAHRTCRNAQRGVQCRGEAVHDQSVPAECRRLRTDGDCPARRFAEGACGAASLQSAGPARHRAASPMKRVGLCIALTLLSARASGQDSDARPAPDAARGRG